MGTAGRELRFLLLEQLAGTLDVQRPGAKRGDWHHVQSELDMRAHGKRGDRR